MLHYIDVGCSASPVYPEMSLIARFLGLDVLTPAQRKLNMSHVRGRDTKPEMVIRQGLHARGFRYRLHDKTLPGRPDLVFAKYRTVVFVHGCFWHAHGCSRSKLPATRRRFWKEKLEGNAARDQRAVAALQACGLWLAHPRCLGVCFAWPRACLPRGRRR